MRDVDEIFHVWERTRQSLCLFQGDGDSGDGDVEAEVREKYRAKLSRFMPRRLVVEEKGG